MKDLFIYKNYIYFSVKAKLIKEIVRNHLGFLWWFIEPILQMTVYYFVFVHLLKRRTEEFTLFLLIGIITWQWFANSVQLGSASIKQAASIMKQIYFPKTILPSIAVIFRTIKFIIVISVIMLWISVSIGGSITWVSLPVIFFTQLTIVYSGALITAAIIPFVPDMSFIVSSLLSAGFFCSGVFFEVKPDNNAYHLFMLNPMAKILEQYRAVLLHNQWPEWYSLGKICLIGTFSIVILFQILRKLDKHYPRVA